MRTDRARNDTTGAEGRGRTSSAPTWNMLSEEVNRGVGGKGDGAAEKRAMVVMVVGKHIAVAPRYLTIGYG